VERTEMGEAQRRLDLLDKRIRLDLSVNDLRIVLNCLRALQYQMELDDEPYLDQDGLSLKKRLEIRYREVLRRLPP
jgi:hypothetical protein